MPIITKIIVQCDGLNCTKQCQASLAEYPGGDTGLSLADLPENWDRKRPFFKRVKYFCPEHR